MQIILRAHFYTPRQNSIEISPFDSSLVDVPKIRLRRSSFLLLRTVNIIGTSIRFCDLEGVRFGPPKSVVAGHIGFLDRGTSLVEKRGTLLGECRWRKNNGGAVHLWECVS